MTNEKDAVNAIDYNKMNIAQWLLRIIQGALIGIGCILPGVSGGMLCVLFGIYKPMMAFLTHPISALKKHYKFLIAIAVGFVLGFLGLAMLLKTLIQTHEAVTSCLFAGLVIGMMPSLFREAGKKGRTKWSWVSAIISFLIMLPVFYFLSKNSSNEGAQSTALLQSTPDILKFTLCGVVWGASLLFPGVSAASLLMVLGLFEPMVNEILSVKVLLPMLLGTVITGLLVAKLINRLLERHYSVFYHAIFGMVAASILLIIPYASINSSNLMFGVVFGIVGCIAALGLDFWGERLKAKKKL